MTDGKTTEQKKGKCPASKGNLEIPWKSLRPPISSVRRAYIPGPFHRGFFPALPPSLSKANGRRENSPKFFVIHGSRVP